jgi:hypothetical protein
MRFALLISLPLLMTSKDCSRSSVEEGGKVAGRGKAAKGMPNTEGSAKWVPKTGKAAKGVPNTGSAAKGAAHWKTGLMETPQDLLGAFQHEVQGIGRQGGESVQGDMRCITWYHANDFFCTELIASVVEQLEHPCFFHTLRSKSEEPFPKKKDCKTRRIHG